MENERLSDSSSRSEKKGVIVRASMLLLACIAFANVVHAGVIPESLISDSIKSFNAAEREARGGISVSLWVILFYIFYLGTIWAFSISMLLLEPRLPNARRRFAKYFCRANIFLASGDTAMFVCFLIAYLFPAAFQSQEGAQSLFQLLLLGVFSTSLTMSVYYFYIGLYYKERFANGAWTVILLLILMFFAVRLFLHYNPENIWFSMMLPPGQPNYSAWLRNAPLFLYGLCAVITVTYLTWKQLGVAQSALERKVDVCVITAMCALVVSFVLYALDVFYSHRIPHQYIWIIYTLKTLAYMVAMFFMWLGEFHFGTGLQGQSAPES